MSTGAPPCASYRLVVFDFDGTLVDSLPWLYSVLDEVTERFELARLDRRQLEQLRQLDGRAILERLGVPLWKVPVVAAHMRALAARDLHRLELFDGVPGMLRALRAAGLELAVVSSNATENIQRVLGVETAAFIGHYECGASMFGKPRKLKRVLAKSGVGASEAIYVGDEVRDAAAAAAVGMAFGAVSWGYNTADALRQQAPTELFASFDDLVHKLTGST
jgi:phosphoglycolate phosphatase